MTTYSFLLPRPKLNTYNWFAFLLVLLNGIYILYSLNSPAGSPSAIFLSRVALVICFMSAAIFLAFRKKPIGNYSPQQLLLAMAFASFYYISDHQLALALVMALMSLLYFSSFRNRWIRVMDTHISYPGLLPVRIAWEELNNVILKDGMLTIDRKDDRLLQLEITEYVNEQEFNEFCRERLNPNNNS